MLTSSISTKKHVVRTNVSPRRAVRVAKPMQCRSFLPGYDLPPLAPEDMLNGTYATLATMAGLFVCTFGVAPRFRESFKEADTWRDIFKALVEMGGVSSLTPTEAVKRCNQGATLVDVRMNRSFVNGAIEGSDNFALYQPISGWGLAANIRRAGFSFFGIYGTERNMGWLAEVESWIPKDQEIIVACEMGGSMDCKPGADAGFQSQSLKAVYFLKRAGYKSVLHLKGGVDEYKRTVAPLISVENCALDGQRCHA